MYTDGTDYDDGNNQLSIYAQAGTLRAVYKTNHRWGSRNWTADYYASILGSSVSSIIYDITVCTSVGNLVNYCIREETTCSTTGYTNSATGSTQGIGSGAGYIEVSNGTYAVESSMN